jgi:putative ABC transport system permease protein
VNESLARRYWPDAREALGRRIRFDGFGSPPRWLTIVGVVGDVRNNGLDREARAEAYVPFFQADNRLMDTNLVLRGSGRRGIATPARGVIRRLNKDLPVSFRSMDSVIDDSLAQRRYAMLLMSIFAALALFLALIGIYSVISWTAGRRGREIAIRMALGARPTDVVRTVIRGVMKLVAVGIALGAAGAVSAARLLENALFGVARFDPLVVPAAAVLLAGAALVAGWLPARRAARIDPSLTLRAE